MNPELIYAEMEEQRFRPRAFDEWREYRSKVTDFLLGADEDIRSVAICGAGRCNDLDIKRLHDRFESITLFDIRPETTKEGLERYGLSSASDITIREADFVGIPRESYIDLTAAVLRFLEKEGEDADAEREVYDTLSGLYEKASGHMVDLGEKRFDAVCAIGVHSQLNSTAAWVIRYCAERTGKEITERERRMLQEVIDHTDGIVSKFDRAMIRAAKISLFIGCETAVVGRERPVEGARQSFDDLSRLKAEGMIKQAASLETVWPYDAASDRAFRMKLLSFSC